MFVFRGSADHSNNAPSFNDFALIAHLFHRWPDFHDFSPLKKLGTIKNFYTNMFSLK
ncbi:hypothetical protein OUM_1419 [Helicobacter pylori R038b]|uniref:Uncharacterized protein n=1 Tax=Helicobacter pylori R038b TaxID=1145115 RepID=K2L4L9_HELPX|nr:hypothetical protein OUM_1419 [Helicobacter pylori R038b]